VMVLVPRRLLLELRTQLATVAAEADALLPPRPEQPEYTVPDYRAADYMAPDYVNGGQAAHAAAVPAVPIQRRGQAHPMRPGSQSRVHGGTRLARTPEGLSPWQ